MAKINIHVADRRKAHALLQKAVDKRAKELLTDAEKVGLCIIGASDIKRAIIDSAIRNLKVTLEDALNIN